MSRERWRGVLVGAFALVTLVASCSGGESPEEQAQRRAEREQPTETNPPAGQGEQSGTTQPSHTSTRQRRPRAVVWVTLENEGRTVVSYATWIAVA